jgi:glycosyltransferase involved in cell wall biosynthesis
MKIGFDAKRMFLNNRGLGNYARNLLYGLVKYQSGNDYFLYTPKVSNEHISPNVLRSKNIHLKTPSGIFKSASSYWRSYRLGMESTRDNLDIFHGLAQELPKDIVSTKTKSIVTVHDIIFMKHPEFYKPIDRWIYFKKLKFAVENADVILAISEQTKNDILFNFNVDKDKVIIVYQSCNEVFYSKRNENELKLARSKWNLPKQFILYVGALNENKNVMVILEAMAQLKDNFDLPLVVVGHGKAYKEKLLAYAQKMGISNRIFFTSEIANPSPLELSVFYQLASVFIFPSFYEGFGIPILESRFSGTPVIASNSTCLDEAGGSDTRYFNPNSAEELASILLEIESLKPSYPDSFKQEVLSEQLMNAYHTLYQG